MAVSVNGLFLCVSFQKKPCYLVSISGPTDCRTVPSTSNKYSPACSLMPSGDAQKKDKVPPQPFKPGRHKYIPLFSHTTWRIMGLSS